MMQHECRRFSASVGWWLALMGVVLAACSGGTATARPPTTRTPTPAISSRQPLLLAELSGSSTASISPSSNASTIAAIDMASGAIVWHYADGERDANIASLLVDDTLYTLRTYPGTTQPNALVALRVADGAVRWKIPTSGFHWTFQVSNQLAILMTGAHSTNTLTAYHVADGTQAWTTTLPTGLERQGTAWLAAAGLLIIAVAGQPGKSNAQLLGIRIADGKTAWQVDLGKSSSQPTLIDQVLIVSACQDFDGQNCGLRALNVTDGTTLWQLPALGAILGTTTDGSQIYADITALTGKTNLNAIDVHTGQTLWQSPIPSLTDQPALQGDMVVHLVMYPNGANELWAWQANTGHLQWRTLVHGSAYFTAGNKVFVPYTVNSEPNVTPVAESGFSPALNAFVSRYNLSSGKEEATLPLKNNVYSLVVAPKSAVDGTAYFLLDQTLLAFDSQSGTVQWNLSAPSGWQFNAGLMAFDATTAFVVSQENDQVHSQIAAIDAQHGITRWLVTLASPVQTLTIIAVS